MAKPVQKKKITVNRKAVSAVTLLLALALTVVFVTLGITGRDMDAQGLYKLLPWLPTPGETTLWRRALVPGAELGDTIVQTYTQPAAADASDEDLTEAVSVLTARLINYGWTDAVVETSGEGQINVTLPASADPVYVAETLASRGEYSFTDPEGNVFLTGDHIDAAGFTFSDQTGTSYALSFQFDKEGQEIFAQKSSELVGQSITLLRDGLEVASPSISTPLTQGAISIPNFPLEEARDNAILMRSGALPFSLTLDQAGVQGTPLMGINVQRNLIILLFIAFVLIAALLIVRHRLAGVMAAWMLLLQLTLSYFFAALIGAGFTVSTLVGIYGSFLVMVFALINLFGGMNSDIRRGRSVRQAIKEGYMTRGHASLDVYAGLIFISVIMIIMDQGAVKAFFEVFALGLLLGLTLTHLALRLVMNEAINLLGAKSPLYTAPSTLKKEA